MATDFWVLCQVGLLCIGPLLLVHLATRCWADLGVRRLSYSFLAVFVLTFAAFIVVDYAFYNFPSDAVQLQ